MSNYDDNIYISSPVCRSNNNLSTLLIGHKWPVVFKKCQTIPQILLGMRFQGDDGWCIPDGTQMLHKGVKINRSLTQTHVIIFDAVVVVPVDLPDKGGHLSDPDLQGCSTEGCDMAGIKAIAYAFPVQVFKQYSDIPGMVFVDIFEHEL